MSRTQITTGVAVAVALAVVAFFFIYGSVASVFGGMGGTQAAVSPAPVADSQLVVQDEKVGTGEVAQPGDVITVNYTGKLSDGTVFDTSIGKTPYQFVLGAGNVIPGWDQGLQGMKVGGTRLLIVPPALAYGTTGRGPIPPNATLIFEVTLVSVSPAQVAPEGPSAN